MHHAYLEGPNEDHIIPGDKRVVKRYKHTIVAWLQYYVAQKPEGLRYISATVNIRVHRAGAQVYKYSPV